jgi:hypothetical protein
MILIDGTDRAFGNACPAIQTVVGIDIEHPLILIETLGRADDRAVEVFAVDTGFGDDVRHQSLSKSRVRNRIVSGESSCGAASEKPENPGKWKRS